MFVACDILGKVFKPLPSDIEAVDNMVYKRKDESAEDFSSILTQVDRNKLLDKMVQNKFLLDSKYKIHKECWIAVVSQLVRASFIDFKQKTILNNTSESNNGGGVWDQICNQMEDTQK